MLTTTPKKACAAGLLLFLLLGTQGILTSCGEESIPTGAEGQTTDLVSTGENTDEILSAPDVAEIGKTLSETCVFSEPLSENAGYLIAKFPELSDILVSYTAYVPVGVTPEEIFVFETVREDDTEKVTASLSAYVEQQVYDYGRYKESALPLLEDPVIYVDGTLVVYVISGDHDTAEAAVASLFQNS